MSADREKAMAETQQLLAEVVREHGRELALGLMQIAEGLNKVASLTLTASPGEEEVGINLTLKNLPTGGSE